MEKCNSLIIFIVLFLVYLDIKKPKISHQADMKNGETMYIYEIIKPGTWIDSED
jgi:hypothetical protein